MGRPAACLPLLIELYLEYGGDMENVGPEIGTDEDEPYAWEECYADDPC